MHSDRDHKRVNERSSFFPAAYGVLLIVLCLLIEPLLWGKVIARVLPDSSHELREEQLEPIAKVVRMRFVRRRSPARWFWWGMRIGSFTAERSGIVPWCLRSRS